jgi:hypothetical protein
MAVFAAQAVISGDERANDISEGSARTLVTSMDDPPAVLDEVMAALDEMPSSSAEATGSDIESVRVRASC